MADTTEIETALDVAQDEPARPPPSPLVADRMARRFTAEGTKLGRPSKLSPADRAAIIDSRNQGVSLGAMAAKYGVTRGAIQHVQRAGA